MNDVIRTLEAERKAIVAGLPKKRTDLASATRSKEREQQAADAEQVASGRSWGQLSGLPTAAWVEHNTASAAQATLERDLRESVRVDEQRLAYLDNMLGAPCKVETETAAVLAADQEIAATEARTAAAEAAVVRNREQAELKFTASVEARRVLAEIERRKLPPELQEELGVTGAPPAPPAVDPHTSEQLGVAFSEAAEMAERKVTQSKADLQAAHQARRDAMDRLLAARALVAELEHAEGLAAYLPKWVAYRAAHDLAYGYLPEAPMFKVHADEAHAAALEAARAAAEPKPALGLIARVRAALS